MTESLRGKAKKKRKALKKLTCEMCKEKKSNKCFSKHKKKPNPYLLWKHRRRLHYGLSTSGSAVSVNTSSQSAEQRTFVLAIAHICSAVRNQTPVIVIVRVQTQTQALTWPLHRDTAAEWMFTVCQVNLSLYQDQGQLRCTTVLLFKPID